MRMARRLPLVTNLALALAIGAAGAPSASAEPLKQGADKDRDVEGTAAPGHKRGKGRASGLKPGDLRPNAADGAPTTPSAGSKRGGGAAGGGR